MWHDDMLSTLMVVDGIKALSGGHNRCSEPRPSVALHRRRAVISVPHCQRAPPPLPKILSICHISGADWVQGLHFSSINCCVLAWPVSANEGSCVTIHLLQPSQGQLLSFCLRVKKNVCFVLTQFQYYQASKNQTNCETSTAFTESVR